MTTPRVCSRPLCSRAAEVVLDFEYENRHVELRWSGPLHDPNLLELCVDHAERFRCPNGWTQHDAREPVIALRAVGQADAVNQ